MKTFKFILITTLMLASPAFAADRFDLVCVGTKTKDKAPNGTYEIRYRIDLTKISYCVEDCNAVLPIKEVNPNEIVFTDRYQPSDIIQLDKSRVDRRTGKYTASMVVKAPTSTTVSVEAVCTPQPFTPFPETKF